MPILLAMECAIFISDYHAAVIGTGRSRSVILLVAGETRVRSIRGEQGPSEQDCEGGDNPRAAVTLSWQVHTPQRHGTTFSLRPTDRDG